MALDILKDEEDEKKREEELMGIPPASTASDKQISFVKQTPLAWMKEQDRKIIQEEVQRGHRLSPEGFLSADELTGLATATAESGWAKITRPDGTSEFVVVDAQGESYSINQIKSSLSKQKAAFESVGEPGAGVAFMDQLSKTFSTSLAPDSQVVSEPTPDMVMDNFFGAMLKEGMVSEADLEEMKKLSAEDEETIAVVDAGGISMETYLPVIDAAVKAREDGSPKMVALIAGLTRLADDKQFMSANPLQKKLIAYSIIDQTSRLIADRDIQMVSRGLDKLKEAETGLLDAIQFELETARPDIELKDFEFQYSDEEVEAASKRIADKDSKIRDLKADFLKIDEDIAAARPKLREIQAKMQASQQLVDEARRRLNPQRNSSQGAFGTRTEFPKPTAKERKELENTITVNQRYVTEYRADMEEINTRLKPQIDRRNLLVEEINATASLNQEDVQIVTGKGIMPRGKLRQIVGQYADQELEGIMGSPAEYVKAINDNAFTFNGEKKDYVNASAAYFVDKITSKWAKNNPKSRALTEQLERDVFASIQNGTLKQDFPGIYQGSKMLADKYEQYQAYRKSLETAEGRKASEKLMTKWSNLTSTLSRTGSIVIGKGSSAEELTLENLDSILLSAKAEVQGYDQEVQDAVLQPLEELRTEQKVKKSVGDIFKSWILTGTKWDENRIAREQQKIQQQLPTVTTQQQFDALDSGDMYIGKDGNKYRKP